MSRQRELKAGFEAVKASRDKLSALARSNAEDWKTQYARTRLELADSMSALEATARKVETATDEDWAAEYHAAVVNFRKRLERHQARWPVLVIKDRGPDYSASMDEVDAAFGELMRLTARL